MISTNRFRPSPADFDNPEDWFLAGEKTNYHIKQYVYNGLIDVMETMNMNFLEAFKFLVINHKIVQQGPVFILDQTYEELLKNI